MPALGALPFVALALIAFLLAVGIAWALRGIAQALESANPFGAIVSIGSWVAGLADALEGALTSAGSYLWGYISSWVSGHAYLISELASELAGLAANTREAVSYTAGTAIPNAVRSAQRFAIETGLLFKHETEESTIEVMGGIAAVIGGTAGAIYGLVSGGGPPTQHSTAGAFAETREASNRHADAQVYTAEQVLRLDILEAEARLRRELAEARTQIGHAAAEAAAKARGELTAAEAVLRGEISAAEGTAEAHLKDARTHLERAIQGAEGAAKAQLTEAREDLERLVNSHAAAARSELERARVKLEGELTTAEGAEHKALEGQKVELQARIVTAENTAARELGDVRGKLETAVHGAEGKAKNELTEAVDHVTRAINVVSTNFANELEHLFTGTIEDLTGAAVAVGGDLTALPALLAAAITAPMAALASRVATIEECAVTRCEGPNNLERLLETGLSAAALTALAALLAEWVNEPQNSDQAAAAAFGGAYTLGHDAFDALLGL